MRNDRRGVCGGEFVFTNLMQCDDCPPYVAVWFLWQSIAATRLQWSENYAASRRLVLASSRICEELRKNYVKICEMFGDEYVNNMLQGLSHWVDGAQKGFPNWGIMHFRKPDARHAGMDI
jgi:sarcosine/dimethylglycine N-methyltransferase